MTDNTSSVDSRPHLAEAPEADSMYFERRYYRRRSAGGRVTGVITGPGYAEAASKRICSLQLRDLSAGGVGAMVQEPLPVGTTITVFWPPHGPEGGCDLHGTIVRCEPCDWGYSLGIRVDARMAA